MIDGGSVINGPTPSSFKCKEAKEGEGEIGGVAKNGEKFQ